MLRTIIFHSLGAAALLNLVTLLYFYIFLPYTTNHGETIAIPDLEGVKAHEIKSILADYHLRYEISDSSYSENMPPLTVLQQFPRAGSRVKKNRRIYITLNRLTPPNVPLPKLVDQSKTNAEEVLRSNHLRPGSITLTPSPFLNLITEARYLGQPVKEGTPVPKGATIDLVVGDGMASPTFPIESLIGASYEQVQSKLKEWNLNIGKINIPEGIDTAQTLPVVYKQEPSAGEIVQIGDPIDIWLAPPSYRVNTMINE